MRASHTISIHALCEEGDVYFRSEYTATSGISIHALCEEGDSMWMSRKPLTPYFYPRPLRGGRRGVLSFDGTKSEFLSTPSARRATPVRRGAWSRRGYFYPRPLRGGRRIFPKRVYSNIRHFYPRPLRGGRREHFGVVSPDAISIHALCEEGDSGVQIR